MPGVPQSKVLEHEALAAECEEFLKNNEPQHIEQGVTAEGRLKLEKSERKVLNRPLRGL